MEIRIGSYYDPKENEEIENIEDMKEYEVFECGDFIREIEKRMKMMWSYGNSWYIHCKFYNKFNFYSY